MSYVNFNDFLKRLYRIYKLPPHKRQPVSRSVKLKALKPTKISSKFAVCEKGHEYPENDAAEVSSLMGAFWYNNGSGVLKYVT